MLGNHLDDNRYMSTDPIIRAIYRLEDVGCIEETQAVKELQMAAQNVVDAHDAAGPTTEHGLHCAIMGLLAELENKQ